MMTVLLVFVSLVIAASAIFGAWAICSISREADEAAERLLKDYTLSKQDVLKNKSIK
ncbi:hypothetical protein [Streptococcus hyointestinalis]